MLHFDQRLLLFTSISQFLSLSLALPEVGVSCCCGVSMVTLLEFGMFGVARTIHTQINHNPC